MKKSICIFILGSILTIIFVVGVVVLLKAKTDSFSESLRTEETKYYEEMQRIQTRMENDPDITVYLDGNKVSADSISLELYDKYVYDEEKNCIYISD